MVSVNHQSLRVVSLGFPEKAENPCPPPYNVFPSNALDAAGLHTAHMLVVVFERRFAGTLQQLIDGVDRAADDALDRPHRHAFAKEFEDLGALGEGQLVHA